MLIGGLQKVSFIDYPGKMSCVIFTQGCNFRCPFCHNATLVDPAQFQVPIGESEVFNFLSMRKKFLEGVVVSGGEPTLHKDLKQFIEKVRAIGTFAIKLDTNGAKPEVISELVECGLIDFVAMDIKHVWEKYPLACGTNPSMDAIKQSVDFIMSCGIDYEFRTTVVPGIHSPEDIKAIAEQLKDAKKFVIQQFVPDHALRLSLREQKSASMFDAENKELLLDIKKDCLSYVKNFEIRSSAD